ncbi:hypothetical protein L2E82_36312 [Cichorium intybus]|uniref:Uncharacterized protein n=1 Tax=Cichorium intybus TaxID=13427 RepID=A0ACB9BR60_CICIN|nr:hypothetical protein L2E82_36312 [Cichorium intybus]
MAAPNGSHVNWADQVPIAVAPLNCVPYTGPPLDNFDSDMAQNEVNPLLKSQPAMLFLPPQTTEKELNDILETTTHGVVVLGSAASGKIGPLIGAIDISESDDGFLFRVALPGVKKDEKFKCDIQADGTVTINGVTNTGEKKVNVHNMVFEMHTQNLCPPGDFSVSFKLPAAVDPLTLKNELANGVFEGVVNKKPLKGGKQKIEAHRKNAEKNQKSKGSQFEARVVALKVTCPICKGIARQAPWLIDGAVSRGDHPVDVLTRRWKVRDAIVDLTQIGPTSADMAQNGVNPILNNQPAMLFLPPQTTEKELNDILETTTHGVVVSGSAASGIIGPVIGAIDISESDEGFLFRVALPGVKKDEKFKCDIQVDGNVTIQGVTDTGEKKVNVHDMVFKMHTQNLCPPGDFSVSFRLPAPVDPLTLKNELADGVFEGVVNKKLVKGL